MARTSLPKSGKKVRWIRSAVIRPPLPWPKRICSYCVRGAGHASALTSTSGMAASFHRYGGIAALHFGRLEPAVMIIGGAGPLRRDHRRSQRRLGRAVGAEGGALRRLLQPLQNLAADAQIRLGHFNVLAGKPSLGIVVGVRRGEPKPALWNNPDAAPFAVGDFEYFLQQCAGLRIPFAAHNARVLIFNAPAPLLQ